MVGATLALLNGRVLKFLLLYVFEKCAAFVNVTFGMLPALC
jgi:hypothetical protein